MRRQQLDPNWLVAGILVGFVIASNKRTIRRRVGALNLGRHVTRAQHSLWRLYGRHVEAPRVQSNLDKEWEQVSVEEWRRQR